MMNKVIDYALVNSSVTFNRTVPKLKTPWGPITINAQPIWQLYCHTMNTIDNSY
jgi:hypothetical protein